MPEAAAVSVAKAVETQIRAAMEADELATRFTLVRSYADWEFDAKTQDDLTLREEEKLRVDVVGHMTEQTVELGTRGGKATIVIPVDIAVRQRLGRDKQDDDTGLVELDPIDELMLLVQQLYLMFMPIRLTNFAYAVWDGENGGVKILTAPDRRHLRDLRQFTGLIRIYFKVVLDN